MLRDELISACETVVAILTKHKVRETIVRSRPREGSPDGPLALIGLMHSLVHEFAHLREIDLRLLRILGLEILNQPDFWTAVIKGDLNVLHDVAPTLLNTERMLPKIIRLLSDGRELALPPDEQRLRLILPESDAQLSTTERLATALRAASSLYDAAAALVGVEAGPLQVLACDSGSDKAFDLLGVAKAIECVKEILFSLWDRLVSHRDTRKRAQIELVAQALPVLEKIAKLEPKLGPEKAELLRRAVMESACDFVRSGVVIPEFREREIIDSKRLMAAEPKLLASRSSLQENPTSQALPSTPADEQSAASAGGHVVEEEFSPEDEELLEKLLAKRRGGKHPRGRHR